MRRILFGALVLALSAAPAHAERPTLAGDVCDHRTSVNPAGTGEWTAVVRGGPLAAADVVTTVPALDEVLDDNPYAITLTCTLKVGWSNDHTSPAAATASASGLGVAVLPPTLLPYDDPDGTFAAVCTEVTVTDRDGDSATFYWDVYDESFGTDPTVPCGPVFCPLSARNACGGGPPSVPPREVRDAIDIAMWGIEEWVDPAACAVLDDQFPPEGDVPDVWDCPPYQS